GLSGGVHIDDDSPVHAARRTDAHTNDAHRPVGGQLADAGAHLGRSHIQAAHEPSPGHGAFPPTWTASVWYSTACAGFLVVCIRTIRIAPPAPGAGGRR